MCYDESSSIYAFILCSIGSILLFLQGYKESKVIGLFMSYIGCMQMIDLIFWRNQEQNNINFVMTKIGMIVNLCQPLVLFLLVYAYFKKVKQLTLIISGIYGVVVCLYAVYMWNKVDYTLARTKYGPELHWQWVNNRYMFLLFPVYIATVLITLWQHFKHPFNIAYVGLITLTILATFIIKNNKISFQKMTGASVFSRFWCNYGAYLCIVFAFVSFILNQKYRR